MTRPTLRARGMKRGMKRPFGVNVSALSPSSRVEHVIRRLGDSELKIETSVPRPSQPGARAVHTFTSVSIKKVEGCEFVVEYKIALPEREFAYRLDGTAMWFKSANDAKKYRRRSELFADDGRVRKNVIEQTLDGCTNGADQASSLASLANEMYDVAVSPEIAPIEEPAWVGAKMIPIVAGALGSDVEHARNKLFSHSA